MALFGDIAPITTPRLTTPAGFKIVRIDMQTHQIVNFAVNKYTGPSSKLPQKGFERPSHCQFGPDGALYVVDFGEIELAPERGGIRMPLASGALWRIKRVAQTYGDKPADPTTVPLYALLAGALVGGIMASVGVLLWFVRRLSNHKKG